MTDARRERLKELLEQRGYAAALDVAVAELRSLGLTVDRADAVTKEAVSAAHQQVAEQDRYHLIWHRVWGVRLRDEVLATSVRLADLLHDERAVLVWRSWPADRKWPVSSVHVGFLVSVAEALRQLPAHIGPDEGEVGPGGIGSDLLLVSEDGESGIRLEYNHNARSDEYELRSWGRYARVVEG
jgi:hypothetical protein